MEEKDGGKKESEEKVMPTKPSKSVSPGVRGNKQKKGVRSPTAHRTLEQTQKTAKKGGYQASTKRKKYRSELGKLPPAGPGKDNAHGKSHIKGGKATKANTKPTSRAKNRGHGTTKGKKANRGK